MERHTRTTAFRGRDGRPRTAWRVAMAYLGFLVVELAVLAALELPLQLAHAPLPVIQAVGAPALAAAMLGLVICLRRFADRRPWRDVVPRLERRAVALFALGLLMAVVTLGAATAASAALGLARPRPYALTAAVAGALAFRFVFIAVSEAFPEELLFRGYVFRNLSAALPLWAAWALTGVLFGALHIVSGSGADSLPQQLLFVVMAIGFGLLLTSARVVTGGLWLGMGIHTGVDFLLFGPAGGVLGYGAASQARYSGVLVVTAVCLAGAALAILLLGRRSAEPALSERAPEPAAAPS